MTTYSKIYITILLLFVHGVICARQERLNPTSFVDDIAIIPKPSTVKRLKSDFFLNRQTTITYNDKSAMGTAELLNEFLFSNYGFRLKAQKLGSVLSKNPTINLLHLTSTKTESYKLDIQKGQVKIAGDAAGLFYGIQTLQQLLPVQNAAQLKLPGVFIVDEPRFAYRGLMLDVSRHFFPVSYIKKFINIMSQYKFNNFHWHLTDDQGWRIEIKKYPNLQAVGAWREPTSLENGSPQIKNGRYGGYYTQEEIKEVVAFANTRHINIIPEIEMPGHSNAALAAYPWLGCINQPYKVLTRGTISPNVYCAGNDSVFNFLEGVLDEVVALFPGKYIHIGGDETPKDRWKVCAKCQARIKNLGLKDEHELQSYFVQRIEKYINAKGRTIIGWDEILEGGLAPNATVMSWRGESGGIEAARLHHDVVMSPYPYVYLDYSQGSALEPHYAGGYTPLSKVYSYDPLPSLLTEDQQKYIKGIQANTWAEQIPNENHVDYMVYPRALAVAEIGWSIDRKKDFKVFSEKVADRLIRLDQQQVNFRIPEPYGLRDSITTVKDMTITLRPAVKGAVVYFTTDGSAPTEKSPKADHPIVLSLIDNTPILMSTLTILPSGRKSAIYTGTYLKKSFHQSIQPTVAPQSGLQFKTIYKPVKAAKTFSIESADTSGTIKSFSLTSFANKSVFATSYEGYFLADTAAIYTFKINSDDGAVLYIDDELIVDNDGQHPPTEKTGAVPLLIGLHKISLKYFDGGGGKALNVSVAVNGLAYELKNNLFH